MAAQKFATLGSWLEPGKVHGGRSFYAAPQHFLGVDAQRLL
jgi:hypothetical protein